VNTIGHVESRVECPLSRCDIYGIEEWQQNKYTISGTSWYFIHHYLWAFEIKKNFSEVLSRRVEFGWQVLETKIAAVKFGGPPSTAFIKVASTKRTKDRFRRKGTCGLNTNIVAQNEFLPTELEVSNFEILCHKIH
jgi:hypothetical protein